jgi:DNA mismatch endonuclease (patch repair protein)
MKRVKGKNSEAERPLRAALHAEGLRFRLHRRIVGITADVVFPGEKIVVFVDGCFWHGCPKHATFPKSNQGYWLPKLKENKSRDKRQSTRLRKEGWTVIRLWGHECLPPAPGAITRIMNACRQKKLMSI